LIDGAIRSVVTQNFASWNQIGVWLRRLDLLRRTAFDDLRRFTAFGCPLTL
jgi:hypothetical protein